MENISDPDPAKLYGSFGSGSATLILNKKLQETIEREKGIKGQEAWQDRTDRKRNSLSGGGQGQGYGDMCTNMTDWTYSTY